MINFNLFCIHLKNGKLYQFNLFLLFLLEKNHLETTFKSNDINALPVISIYGANASGKTGVLEDIYFMLSIVKYSNSIDITDKDEMGKSSLYSLSEFRNLRYDLDYEKRYLSGQFGGIPFEDK